MIHPLIYLLFSLLVVVRASQKITIDDSSSLITYSGVWEVTSVTSSLFFGGSHHHSTDPGATAAVTFVGMSA